MRIGGRTAMAVLSVLTSLLAALSADAATRPRMLVVLPYATVDLASDELWIGEGISQSLALAFDQMPAVVQVDRDRVNRLPRPDRWDDPTALSAARVSGADIAVYGEVRRVGPDLSIHPRLVEIKGERGERRTLDAVAVPDGALLERLAGLPAAYVRALKLTVSEGDSARAQKWASPTTSRRAFEAFVRGQQAAQRGGQEANETAVELLGKAIEVDPQFAVAQYTLGTVHQSLGNLWKAHGQFRVATQLDAAYPEPYKAIGDLFFTAPRRQLDQAIEAYSKALAIRPFYADAHIGLGDARAAKGEVDGAVSAYQKALTYNPLNAKVHMSLGKLYYSEKGLFYESVEAYKKAIDLDGNLVDARMGLAEVYEDKGLYQEAIGEYRKVVEQDRKHTGALYNLALVYEKVDTKEAIALWERYIDLAGPLQSEKDWVDVAKLHLRKLRSQPDKSN